MSPTRHLDDVAAAVQVVVDGMRVGDQIAAIAGQHAVDGLLVVLGRVRVQDVPLGRDEHPEVADAALLLGLHQDAGGVGAQVRRAERVLPHGVDERRVSARPARCASRKSSSAPAPGLHERRSARADTAAGGPASAARWYRRAVPVRPARARSAARAAARPTRSVSAVALAVFAHELGPVTRTTTSDAGRRSTVSLTSSPMRSNASTPFALDLVGQDLDLDARQLLGQRLTAVGFCALVLADGCVGAARSTAGRSPSSVASTLHRELRVVGAEALGFLPEQPELELAALLEHPQIQLAIVLALGREPLDVRVKGRPIYSSRVGQTDPAIAAAGVAAIARVTAALPGSAQTDPLGRWTASRGRLLGCLLALGLARPLGGGLRYESPSRMSTWASCSSRSMRGAREQQVAEERRPLLDRRDSR